MPRFTAFLSGRVARFAAAAASGLLLTTAYRSAQCQPGRLALDVPPAHRALERPNISNSKSQISKFPGAFALGFIAGLAFFIPNLAWVRHSSRVLDGASDDRWMGWSTELMGWSAVLAMCLYMSLYWGVWGAFAATSRPASYWRPQRHPSQAGSLFSFSLESLRSAFLNAALWAGLEWARGIVLTGFNWNGLGVPLASELALVQAADIVGVSGLSFMTVFCCCVAFNTALRFREEARTARVRPHLDFFCAVALVLADFIYGFRILSAPPSKDTIPLRVAAGAAEHRADREVEPRTRRGDLPGLWQAHAAVRGWHRSGHLARERAAAAVSPSRPCHLPQ